MTQKTVTWTAGSGQEITVCVSADYEFDRQGRRKSRGYKVVEISCRIDGRQIDTFGGVQKVEHPQIVAKIGVIGLLPETYAKVQAAIDDVRASFADHNAALDRHAAELDAVTDEGRRIEKSMRCGE